MRFPRRQDLAQGIARGTVAVLTLMLLTALAEPRPALAQTESVLYSFCSVSNCAAGSTPIGGLVADTVGNLYGTTLYGGANSSGGVAGGAVFKLNPAGDESVFYSFHNGFPNDGYFPYGPLTIDAQGNLYGTTELGGAHSIHVAHGDGIAFKVSPDGTETILHNFGAYKIDGVEPRGGMVVDAKGNIYGSTFIGGASEFGTVFRITPEGTESVLHNFAYTNTDGGYPWGASS